MRGTFCDRCGREFESGEVVTRSQLVTLNRLSEDTWEESNVKRESLYYCLDCQ